MNEYLLFTLILGYIPLIRILNGIHKKTSNMEKSTSQMLEKMKKVDSIIEKIRES
jgi:hypothetical protein